MNLPAPDCLEEFCIDDVLAEDAEDRGAPDSNESILRVQIVECAVLRIVESVDDKASDRLGVFRPPIGFAGFAQSLGHCGQRHASAIHGGGKIGAKPRQAFGLRAFARIAVGAAVRNALPARAIVLAGVVSTEALAQPGAAGIPVATQPCIPAPAGGVGLLQQLGIVRLAGQLPGRGCDRDDHLDLAEAGTVCLDAAGQLPIFLLQREKDQVIVTCDVTRD